MVVPLHIVTLCALSNNLGLRKRYGRWFQTFVTQPISLICLAIYICYWTNTLTDNSLEKRVYIKEACISHRPLCNFPCKMKNICACFRMNVLNENVFKLNSIQVLCQAKRVYINFFLCVPVGIFIHALSYCFLTTSDLCFWFGIGWHEHNVRLNE